MGMLPLSAVGKAGWIGLWWAISCQKDIIPVSFKCIEKYRHFISTILLLPQIIFLFKTTLTTSVFQDYMNWCRLVLRRCNQTKHLLAAFQWRVRSHSRQNSSKQNWIYIVKSIILHVGDGQLASFSVGLLKVHYVDGHVFTWAIQ